MKATPVAQSVAHIAEHHRLHVDRRAPVGGDVVQPAIGDGARVHPGAEDRADRAPQLLLRVLREGLAALLRDDVLETGDDRLPILGGELGVEHGAAVELVVFEQLLEMVVVDAEHDLAVHLDEAAIAVIGEALVAALARQPDDRSVVEPEVEHRIHHARHRDARARAHRDQQRIVGVAEPRAERALERGERRRRPGPAAPADRILPCA